MKKAINSDLILASKNGLTGDVVYTWKLTYPYIIHGEVMTHRVFSRNAASSRAVPMKKMRQNVLRNPFVPYSLGRNQKGMQAGAEQGGWRRALAVAAWKTLRYPAVFGNWSFDKLGVHKQIGNRFLMPWMWMETLVTTTEVTNFFKLRDHTDAEPHFHTLARLMKRQVIDAKKWLDDPEFKSATFISNWGSLTGAKLQVLASGEWHLPFIDDADVAEARKTATEVGIVPELHEHYVWGWLKQWSVARCARVSYYLPQSGKRSDSAHDYELHNRLRWSGHWSPFEHVATPIATSTFVGNFRGWMQYRKEFKEEDGQ